MVLIVSWEWGQDNPWNVAKCQHTNKIATVELSKEKEEHPHPPLLSQLFFCSFQSQNEPILDEYTNSSSFSVSVSALHFLFVLLQISPFNSTYWACTLWILCQSVIIFPWTSQFWWGSTFYHANWLVFPWSCWVWFHNSLFRGG